MFKYFQIILACKSPVALGTPIRQTAVFVVVVPRPTACNFMKIVCREYPLKAKPPKNATTMEEVGLQL